MLKTLKALTLAGLSSLLLTSFSQATETIEQPGELPDLVADAATEQPTLKDHGYNFHEKNNIVPEVETLTTELFGDKIDPGSGSLSFEQTDISIPGNSALPVAITRTLSDANSWYRETRDFENWSLAIPHVRSTYVTDLDGSTRDYRLNIDDFYPEHEEAYWAIGKACSKPLNANSTLAMVGNSQFYYARPVQYWNGDSAYIPGRGTARFTTKEGDLSYKRYNNLNWDVECITTSAGHEGFKITLDDGTRYYFTQQRIVRSLKDFDYSPKIDIQPCRECPPDEIPENPEPNIYKSPQYYIFMLASKVEDRFGNWVQYQYDSGGKLQKITANDNRTIEVFYSGERVSSIKALGKTWSYSYHDDELNTLTSVTLPDNRQWRFSHDKTDGLSFWRRYYIEGYEQFSLRGAQCFAQYGTRNFVTITHPQGMQGEFTLAEVCHGKSDVPKILQPNPYGMPYDTYWITNATNLLSIRSKKLTFGDGQSYLWRYDYSDNTGVFRGDAIEDEHRLALNISGVESANFKATTITRPDNSREVQYFDRRFGRTSGNLSYHEIYSSSGSLLQRSSYQYVDGTYHGSPETFTYIQTSENPWHDDDTLVGESASRRQLTSGQVITFPALGDSYTTRYSDFDLYDYPGLTIESNSVNDKKRYTRQGYYHNIDQQLLGLPTTTALSQDGVAYTQTREISYYSASHASYPLLPQYEKAFGVWQKYFSAYHGDGNLKKIEFNVPLSYGSGNRYQQYSNFKRGQPQTITIPAPYGSGTLSVSRTIDDNGWVTQSRDFENNITNYGYDSLGRIRYIDPADSTWADTLFQWRYDGGSSANQPVRAVSRCRLTDAKTACADTPVFTATTTYDNLLRPTRIASSDGSRTVYQNSRYNHTSQPLFSSYPSTSASESAGTTSVYDALGRLLSQSLSGGGTVSNEYLSSNRVKTTDARGNVTTTSYLAYGSPAIEQALSIVSPENVTTSLAVNLFGNITAISQSGKNGNSTISQTEYRAYDSRQRLCQIKRTDVGTTVMSHNNFGEVLWQAGGQSGASNTACNTSANGGDKISFSYDNHGNQHTLSYGDGTPTRTYTVNNNGDIETIVGGGYRQEYRYNSLRLLDEESLIIDGKTFKLAYGYDALGSLNRLGYPGGELAVDFAPNGFGQATKATWTQAGGGVFNFVKPGASYYPSGSINSFTYGNGINHKTTLNSRLLPQQIHDSLGSTNKVKLSYGYDNNNNITAITNGVDANFSLSALTYDGLDRLTATTGNIAGIGSSALSYDGLGNIRSYSNTSMLNPSSLTYGYNSDMRLSSVTGSGSEGYNFGQSSSYDSRGNVTNNGKRSFSYNLAGQMTGSGSNSYLYDGYNRRIKTTDSKGTSYSLYSQAGKLMYRETDKGGINYVFLGDKLVAKQGTGVVTKSDDADYNSVMNYKPFGETIEAANDEVGYTGHKFDTDLGLSYMQARYYDPVIGRFYSNDPVGTLGHFSQGNIQGFNRYAYANNNPYKYTDPDGKIPVALLFTPPALAAMGKAAAFVGSAAAAAWAGSEAINAYNESSDPVEGILEGATAGDKTKGRTKNFDKPGGMDQANGDFDDAVDPDSVEAITDGKGGEGRRGTVNDGSGRKINVRPNSSDGRPTVEVQDGKNKTKIRYDEEKS